MDTLLLSDLVGLTTKSLKLPSSSVTYDVYASFASSLVLPWNPFLWSSLHFNRFHEFSATSLNARIVCAPFISYLEFDPIALRMTFVFMNNVEYADAEEDEQSYHFRVVFEQDEVVVFKNVYFPVYDRTCGAIVLRSVPVAFVLIDYVRNWQQPNKTIRENYVLYMAVSEDHHRKYQPFLYSLDVGQSIPRAPPSQLPASFSRIIAVLNYPRPFFDAPATIAAEPQQITVVKSTLGTTSSPRRCNGM